MNCTTIGTRSEATAGAVPDVAAHSEQALLILDKGGDIQFCGAPGFFGYASDEAFARSIRELVPGLALRSNTPGYNLAYVNFWFDGDAWRRFEAVTPDGRPFEVEISLQATRIQNKHWLLAHVRHAAVQPCAAPEAPSATPPVLTLVARAA